jgi:DNA-binding transcriptional LysR family regulator
MPVHAVHEDLEEGRVKALSIEDVPPGGLNVAMSAVWKTKSPPGPAGRWFIARLKEIPVFNSVPKSRAAEAQKPRSRRRA